MKLWLTVSSVLVALVCVALVVMEQRRTDELRAVALAVEQKRQAVAAEAVKQAKRSQHLQTQLREVRVETVGKTAETHELRQQLAEVQAKVDSQKRPAPMFRDPEMKEALKAQAKGIATKTAAALFDAGLGKQLQLDEDSGGALKQMIADRVSIMWDNVLVPMTTGELDESGIAAASKQAKQLIDANTAQMRALVGEDGLKTFEWFERTQPDRDSLNQFARQMANEGNPMNEEQQAQLFTAMIDERANFKFQYDFADPLNNLENWHANLNPESMGVYFRELAQMNDRVLARAQSILSEDQAALLKKYTGHQLQQSKFTVQSTMTLMGRNR